MLSIQYDLFLPTPTQEDLLRMEIGALSEKQDKLRKSLFARHSDLMKLVLKQQKQIDELREMLMRKE